MFFCYSIPFPLPFSRLPPPRALPSATRDGAKVLRSTTGIPVLFPEATWFRGLGTMTPQDSQETSHPQKFSGQNSGQTKVICFEKKHQDFHPKHTIRCLIFLFREIFKKVTNLTHQSEVQSPRRLCESWQAHLATWLPRSPNSSLGWMEFQPLPPETGCFFIASKIAPFLGKLQTSNHKHVH